MRSFVRILIAIVFVCVMAAAGPGALWILGAEATWLSWLPTDSLVVGIHDEFWRQMALGLVNGVVLTVIALTSVVVWQKRSGTV